MHHKCLQLVIMILLTTAVSACTKPEISGRVEDLFGRPVEGVEVRVTGLADSVSTSAEGLYTIRYVPGSFDLLFSMAGYESRKVKYSLGEKQKVSASPVTLVNDPGENPGILTEEELIPLKIVEPVRTGAYPMEMGSPTVVGYSRGMTALSIPPGTFFLISPFKFYLAGLSYRATRPFAAPFGRSQTVPVNLLTFTKVEPSSILRPVAVGDTAYIVMKSADDAPPGPYAISDGELFSMISVYDRPPNRIFPFFTSGGKEVQKEAPSAKIEAPVICAKELPRNVCETAKQAALAIRDGGTSKLAAFAGAASQPNLKVFWHGSLGCHEGCDDKALKTLSFKAFGPTDGNSFVLADSVDGMHSCSFIKDGAGWKAGACEFNDGN